jgi:hypothetical protein
MCSATVAKDTSWHPISSLRWTELDEKWMLLFDWGSAEFKERHGLFAQPSRRLELFPLARSVKARAWSLASGRMADIQEQTKISR